MTLFFSLVSICLLFIYQVPPYYWGNDGYSCKIEDIKNNNKAVSTIAFGSSVMWNNFHPATFDENISGQSYNLASSGMSLPESVYLLENILDKNEMPNLELVLLEICPEIIGYERDNTFRMNYFYSPDIFSMQWGSTPSFLKNESFLDLRSSQLKKFIHNTVSIGMIKKKLAYAFSESENCDDHTHAQGYKVVELWDKKKNRKNRKRKKIPKSKETQRSDEVMSDFEDHQYQIGLHESIVSRLNALSERLKSKNIELVGIFMPRLATKDYKETRDLFSALEIKRLDYSVPSQHPKLWDAKMAVDMRHYNLKGAQMFTRQLATDIQANF